MPNWSQSALFVVIDKRKGPYILPIMGTFFLSSLPIAVALAMDAFSVSVSCGIYLSRPSPRDYFRVAFHFGLFQGTMPLAGYLAGKSMASYIAQWDHWLALALLSLIGLKMIYDGLQSEDDTTQCIDPTRGSRLILLALATSIDAFAVGVTLGVLNAPIIIPALTIGLVCMLVSALGMALGHHVSRWIQSGSEIIGGVLLIMIGLFIVHSHLNESSQVLPW